MLLGVGIGDGLIGLAALNRIGPAGQVIFSDISTELDARPAPRGSPRAGLAASLPVAARGADD